MLLLYSSAALLVLGIILSVVSLTLLTKNVHPRFGLLGCFSTWVCLTLANLALVLFVTLTPQMGPIAILLILLSLPSLAYSAYNTIETAKEYNETK